jgi:hypothetical protein
MTNEHNYEYILTDYHDGVVAVHLIEMSVIIIEVNGVVFWSFRLWGRFVSDFLNRLLDGYLSFWIPSPSSNFFYAPSMRFEY